MTSPSTLASVSRANSCSCHIGLTSSTSAQKDAHFMRNRIRKAFSNQVSYDIVLMPSSTLIPTNHISRLQSISVVILLCSIRQSCGHSNCQSARLLNGLAAQTVVGDMGYYPASEDIPSSYQYPALEGPRSSSQSPNTQGSSSQHPAFAARLWYI